MMKIYVCALVCGKIDICCLRSTTVYLIRDTRGLDRRRALVLQFLGGRRCRRRGRALVVQLRLQARRLWWGLEVVEWQEN